MSRTQLRLGQITGSFGLADGQIRDDVAKATSLAAIPAESGSLRDAMSHMASAIKRIHGASAFSGQDAGVFSHAITGSAGLKISGDLDIDSTADIAGAVNLQAGLTVAGAAVLNGNVDLGDDPSDTVTFVAKVDSDVLPDGARDLGAAGLAWAQVHSDAYYGTGSLSSLAVADLTDNRVLIAGASGEVEDDANFTFDGTTLTLNGARDLSVGQDATIGRNLTVTGDLTVSGDTTTLDVANLLVEDVVIGMASGASAANQNGGVAIFSGSTDSDLVVGRVANDTWGFGKKATQKGTVNDLSDMTLVNARASRYEIDGASDYIDVDTDLQVIASADIKLDPAGGEVVVDGNLVPDSDSADSLGADGTAWLKLFVDDIDLNGVGRIDLDADADTSIRASADDEIAFEIGASDILIFKAAETDIANSANYQLKKSGTGNLGIKNAVAAVDDNVTNGVIGFADGFFTGSSYPGAATGQLPLAKSRVEYDTFQTNFAGASIIDAINQARSGTPGAGKYTGQVAAGVSVAAGNDFRVTGFDRTLMTGGQLEKQSDVYVNGQLLLSGSASGVAARDYYFAGVANNDAVKFTFALEADDVVAIVVR